MNIKIILKKNLLYSYVGWKLFLEKYGGIRYKINDKVKTRQQRDFCILSVKKTSCNHTPARLKDRQQELENSVLVEVAVIFVTRNC